MNKKPQKLAIVTGATGRTGYYIVKELIEKQYLVRIVTRSHEQAKKTFGDLLNKMENPINIDLSAESTALEKKILNNDVQNCLMDFAFSEGPQKQKPCLLVCCQGRNFKTKERAKFVEYVSVKLLINLCQKHKVEKFVLVSALAITRPYSYVPLMLNTFFDNVYYWKTKAENELRQSNLNYIISRPGRLFGDQKQSRITNLTAGQGDKLSGGIERATVAKFLIDLIEDPSVPKQLTYECISTKEQMQQQYSYNKYDFKKDDESSIIKVNHLKAKKKIHFIIYGIIFSLILYFLKR